jgi:hypothetical protein
VANAGQERYHVRLKAHAGPSAESQSPSSEFVLDLIFTDCKAGRKSFDDHDQRLTMRFSGS